MAGVLVVTGGSRGVGAATCRLAAGAGWDVAVVYRERADAAEAVRADCERSGVRARAFRADVSVDDDVTSLFEAVDERFGRLGGLVNNAAVVPGRGRVESYDRARIDRLMAVNIAGTIRCAGEAVKRMSTANGGSGGAIVNVSSLAARLGSGGEWVDYAATKGAVDTFTIGLAQEVVAEGIRVNGVRPGLIDTDMHASGGEPGRVARMAPSIPMQRAGSPEEVARAIVWLLSDEASYVTGAILDVGGGR